MGSEVLWISAGPEPEARWAHRPVGWSVDIRPAEEALDALVVGDYAAIVLELPYLGWRSVAPRRFERILICARRRRGWKRFICGQYEVSICISVILSAAGRSRRIS